MAQLNVGTVRVENASAIVRHIWTVDYKDKTGGPFTAAEGLTWGSDGVGTFVRDDTAGSQLFFYRTSGSNPVAGDTITGTSSSTTVVIDALATVSSGFDFSANVASGDTFTIENSGILYHLSSTIAVDNFTLTGNYNEPTLSEREYAIATDFSTLMGFNKLKVGDLEALTLIGELADQVDTAFTQVALNEQTISSSGGAATIPFKTGHKAAITLTEAVTLTFTAPRGPALLAVRMTQDATGGRTVTWPGAVLNSPHVDPTANSVTLVQFLYDGTNYRPVSLVHRRRIFVWAREMFPQTTTGCAALAQVEVTANRPEYQALDFDGAGATENVQFWKAFPKGWNKGTITWRPYWTVAAAVTTQIQWSLQGQAIGDSDPIDAAWPTQTNVVDQGLNVAHDLHIGPESAAMTIGGTPADEELINFRVRRVSGDGSDTMTQDGRLIGIALFLTINEQLDD